MKKILLTLSLFASVYSTFAQAPVTAVDAVMSTTAAQDDITSTTELSGPNADAGLNATDANANCPGTGTSYNGLFWWTNTGTTNPAQYSGTFTASNDRTTNAGELTYTITQPQNAFEPIGVGFGSYCNGNTKGDFTIDLSGSGTNAKKVSFDFTNLSSTYDVKVELSLQTATGKVMTLLGTVPANSGGNDWQHQQIYNINKNSTLSIVRDFADSKTGAYGASDHAVPLTADWQSVKAVTITVTNQLNTGDPLYQPLVLTNASFKIDNFKIGDVTTITSVNEASSISASKLFPNPATSDVNLSLELKSASAVKVVVSDVLGKEMLTVAEGNFSELNTSFSTESFNAGVYNVTYYVNGSVAKTELLMKK